MMNHPSNEITERRAYSVKEFCSAYRVSRSYVYKLMQHGKLRTVRVGRRRLITVEAAQELLSGGMQ